MKHTLMTVAFVVSAHVACAQNVIGDWQGTLKAGPSELRIALHVESGDSGLRATMDSLDQGATGIPVSSITVMDATLTLTVDVIRGSYKGAINADATVIDGTWTQGISLPLVFTRTRRDSAARASATDAQLLKVDAGGYRLTMLVGGQPSRSTPAVILEAGFGGGGIVAWTTVHPEIAKFAQVVSYDRAGLGGSEKSSTPRSAKQVALELHTALKNAGIAAPYVLVGHSLGGPLVRVFASTYPSEVAGIVLVDPSQEAFNDWVKLHPPPGLKEQEAQIAKAPQGMRDEFAAIDAMLEEARLSKVPPVPITLLSAAKQDAGMPAETREKLNETHTAWIGSIPGGLHVTAEKSGHFIQMQEPQLVVDAIKRVIDQARNRKP
jgi:pimeloyl-ACP methyl ester carboxylesterase